MRVDDRDRRREHLGQPMVVGHDHVDPARAGRRDLGDARRAGVDRDDQGDAAVGRRVDRGKRQPVPLLQARRHVRRDLEPEPPEREHELREAGQPVRVEVAEHHHVLAPLAGGRDAVDRPLRVGQQSRVVEAAEGRAEERRERVRVRDPATRHHGRREGADAQVTGRRAERGIEPVRLGEDPAVPCVDHREQDATDCLSATCRGPRTMPGPWITWRGGGLGEPQSPAPGGDPPRGATRRGAGSR
jgi:hypothetical protein